MYQEPQPQTQVEQVNYVMSQNNQSQQYSNRWLSSNNIGGQLKNILHLHLVNYQGEITVQELDGLLRAKGVPEGTIKDVQKFKQSHFGQVSSIHGVQFEVKLVVIKSNKTPQGKLNINLKVDNFIADYVTPQIQNNYTQGAQYSSRGLTTQESTYITEALKARVNQVKLTYEQN